MASNNNNYFSGDRHVTQRPIEMQEVGGSTQTSLGEDKTKVKLGERQEERRSPNRQRRRWSYQGMKPPIKETIANVVDDGKKVATPDKVNVPFPKVSNKKKLEEFEVVNLTEKCSIVVLKKLLPNLKIQVVSLSFAPWATHILIKHCLVDKTIIHPRSIAKDILVKVGKFIFPTDFVILDMGEDNTVPIILGCFFGHRKNSNEEVKFIVFSFDKISLPLVSCNCVQALDNFKGAISKNYKRKLNFGTLRIPNHIRS
ncbi:hypothetical protein CR513_32016, partial [Mucuna pruriens]